jgi:hypothetical protein
MRRRGHIKSRQQESGFALLFIFGMAATVAIMLYMEIPRVSFEAQRDREQLLIDRGEQYSRAIRLYVRKFNKFPADFDALQSTQNLRFLRHRYVDPMSGKDDWRIIHAGPGGVLTDSLLYGKKKDDKQQAEAQNFISEMQQTGGAQVDPNQTVNLATRQRQSDQPGAPGDPNNPNPIPQFDANGQPIQNAPNGINAPVQVLPNGSIVPVQQGNLPGQFQNGINGFQGGSAPGAPIQPGQPFPGQQPGQPPNGPPAGAAGLINQILTSPRPGGLNGFGISQPTLDQNGNPIPNTNGISNNATTTSTLSAPTSTPTPTATGPQTIGGGIAGVASKRDQDGIKVYRDRKSYKEWEFLYDITKDASRPGGTLPQAPTANGAAAGPNNSATSNNAPSTFNSAPAPNATPAPTQMPVNPP